MSEFKTKEELAMHILKNIAENGKWVNDLEYKFDSGWHTSGNDLSNMLAVFDINDHQRYRVKRPTVTYKIGDRFMSGDSVKYILCQTSSYNCCLINLKDGNRWVDPIQVYDFKAITEQEFHRICDGNVSMFTKVV